MADLDKTFRTPDGETWVRVAGHYFIVKDKEGMVNLQPRPSPPPAMREVKHEDLSKPEQILFEGVLALMDNPRVAWVFAVDDELFYIDGKGTSYLVRQGPIVVLRRRPLPPGARFTFTSDQAVYHMTDIVDDLLDEGA
jgi:hypothetical protein